MTQNTSERTTQSRGGLRTAGRTRRLALPVVGAAALLAMLAPNASAAVAAPEQTAAEVSVTVNDHAVSQVRLHGRQMSLGQYQAQAAPAAARSGRPLTLVLDGSAVQRGYFVAFDNDASTNNYLKAHNMSQVGKVIAPTDEAVVRDQQKQAAAELAATAVPAGTDTVTACALPNHNARLYDGTSCGGSYFVANWNEYDATLSTYGWNDRFSSAAIGDCIANMQLWKDAARGGTRWVLHGGDVYTSMPIGANDTVSSLQTDVTGVC